MKIVTTPNKCKSHTSKAKHKPVHDDISGKTQTQKMYKIKIETTMSKQAPVKSWMICDTIGCGRFGNVRLAINPNVRYRNEQQLQPLDTPTPSITGCSLTTFDHIPGNNVIIEPKFWAVKRAKFVENEEIEANEGSMDATAVLLYFMKHQFYQN